MYMRIKKLRENNGFTPKQIGKMLHMSQTGYSAYETGRSDISIDILKQLALFYNTSVDYILELTDEEAPHPRKT